MLEFLTSLGAPVTASVLIIGLLVLLIAFGSKLLAEVVKIIINEKAWGKEIINSSFISEKIADTFLGTETKIGVIHDDKLYTLGNFQDYFIFTNNGEGLDFNEGRRRYSWNLKGDFNKNISKFKTKEEAYKKAEELGVLVEKEETDFSKPVIAVVGAIAIDVLLHLFSAFPVATLSLIGVSCLVFSVRWLSAKLAENVNKTANHEERIVKLEEEDKNA